MLKPNARHSRSRRPWAFLCSCARPSSPTPAPSAPRHTPLRSPSPRPTRSNMYLPDLATWLLVLYRTSIAPLARQCSTLRPIAPLHSAGWWPGSPLQLVACYWYLADRDGPNCSCAADERHPLLDATAQCSHHDTGHAPPCSLDAGNSRPFARQNPCSCGRRSLLFSTLRLQ